ncbi:hypothetical protein K432DRAFT_269301, partial [Lepidopterella palustris CBS 459.81]
DKLGKLPTEIRLMIFEELFINPSSPVFRGGAEFGKLRKEEYKEGSRIIIPAAILRTCRKYHDEAAPIMHSRTFVIFCTGHQGTPGWFDRFPISRTYMPWVTEIGVYFRVTQPDAETSIRVAHFIKSLTRRATNLRQLVICAASDRYYERICPFDVLWPCHPVIQALMSLISSKSVKHLKIRVHDDAAFSPGLASFLQRSFDRSEPTNDRSLTWTRSCSCPKGCPIHAKEGCSICGRPRKSPRTEDWPIEDVLPNADWCEAGFERMMELENELTELGII